MINPIVLFFGTGSFLASFIIHILLWRIIKPVKQLTWLFSIFILLPILVYAILFFFSSVSINYSQRFVASPFNIFFITIWHFLLSAAYIMTYPAIQVDCPSLKIILAVASSMPQGLTFESISGLLSEDILFSYPFEDLVNEGLIYFKDGKWFASNRGRSLAIFFFNYRRLLGLPQGEG